MDPDLQTAVLQALNRRIQAGDTRALDELLRRAAGRMERMTRSMLRRYPGVRAQEQTVDVLQEALISLTGALRQLTFSSTREFYGLAAEHIRRRLLDLARRYRRSAEQPRVWTEDEAGQIPDPDFDEELDRWQALHEGVAALPADLREAFSLRFYHGWGSQEIADLLQVTSRTVNRTLVRAMTELSEKMGGRPLPGQEAETE
jgi:RNA polymerase sigma-70 factor (ECF subfamily)